MRRPGSSLAALVALACVSVWAGSARAEGSLPELARAPAESPAPVLPRAAGPEPAIAMGEPPAPTRIVSEAPHRAWARPRAEGAVVASVADEELALWNTGGTSRPDHVSNRPGYHVAPRIFVETIVRSGRVPERSQRRGVLSRVAIQAQTRNQGYWPLRLCYEASLRDEPKLRGRLVVRMSIGTRGRVSASRVVDSSASLRTVASCVAEKVRGLRFTPAPARRADVDVSVELSPGDAPLPSLGLGPAPPAPGPDRRLFVDAPAAEASLSSLAEQARPCLEPVLARDPLLWGRLALLLDVEGAGRIIGAKEHESRFPSPDVVDCVRALVIGKELSPLLGGQAQIVWALRVGEPPPKPAPAPAGNPPAPAARQGTVAESPPIRVRVGP